MWKRIREKKGSYVMEVDHTWNLPLSNVTSVTDSPEGYFDTHDTCNYPFKSDKVLPNIGVWNNLLAAADEGEWLVVENSGGAAPGHNYRWPGYSTGLNGSNDHGNKEFYIGYEMI